MLLLVMTLRRKNFFISHFLHNINRLVENPWIEVCEFVILKHTDMLIDS